MAACTSTFGARRGNGASCLRTAGPGPILQRTSYGKDGSAQRPRPAVNAPFGPRIRTSEAAEGLSYMLKQRVFHRDIRPKNLLFAGLGPL